MKSLILALTIAVANPVVAHAQSCVRGEVQRDGSILYPELGPRCPGDNPRSRPTRDQREATDRAYFAGDLARRQSVQGSAVHRMSLDRCDSLVRSTPKGIAPLGPPWHPGEPSPYNTFMTPQENWCLALGRSQESVADNRYPGMLPDGWHATYLGNGTWRVSP